jgi:hypothetical protein
MPTLTDSGFPTLLNVAKRLTPSGSVETSIAETLSKKLDMMSDVPWLEGNLPTGHRITSRVGLPSPTWRRLNQGLDPTKSETAQYDETCGMLESFSKVDVALAELNGNAPAFRKSEDDAFVEAYAQEVARSIFYESTAQNAERLHGLAARYAATSGYTASSQVLKKPGLDTTAGAAGAINESVWLINWEPGRIYGIFPKASKAGLSMNDLGKQLVPDANGKQFLAYVSHFKWDCGLAVQDYRYACRMQFNPNNETYFPDSGKGLFLALQEMLGTVYDVGANARFYMSRNAFKKLMAQLASNSTGFLEYVDGGGKRIPSFLGVPIRITDALVGESAIS